MTFLAASIAISQLPLNLSTIRRYLIQGVISVSVLFLLWNWISTTPTPSTSSTRPPFAPTASSDSAQVEAQPQDEMASPLKHLKVVPKDAHKATVIFLHVSAARPRGS